MLVLAFVNIIFHLFAKFCGLSLILESENRIGVCLQVGYGDCQAHSVILVWYAGSIGVLALLVKCLCCVCYDICDEGAIVDQVHTLTIY